MTAFWETLLDPSAAPYQVRQGAVALGSGGVWGCGLGRGWQKLSFLPEADDDFALAAVGEELGLVGTGGILLLWVALAWFGLRAARWAPPVRRAAAGALALQLAGQALLNAGVVCGLLPPTGIPHPFLSRGGSSLVVTCAAVGLVLTLSRPTPPPPTDRPMTPAERVGGTPRDFSRQGDKGPLVLFCGGGSGGHLMPGLAVADALAAGQDPPEVLFLTGQRPVELRMMAAEPHPHLAFPLAPLGRTVRSRTLAVGFWRCFAEARRRVRGRVCVAVGTGGYASVPGVLGAKLGGAGVTLIEPNATTGRANRLLAPLADRTVRRTPNRKAGLPAEAPVRPRSLLVLGGSAGASALDAAVPAAVAGLPDVGSLHVRHQCAGEAAAVRAAYAAAGVTEVEVAPFFPNAAGGDGGSSARRRHPGRGADARGGGRIRRAAGAGPAPGGGRSPTRPTPAGTGRSRGRKSWRRAPASQTGCGPR